MKLGLALELYDVTYKQLAKRCGLSEQTVYNDAYRSGVTSKFKAMAYAYALDCDISQILESAERREKKGWIQPCLPGYEL